MTAYRMREIWFHSFFFIQVSTDYKRIAKITWDCVHSCLKSIISARFNFVALFKFSPSAEYDGPAFRSAHRFREEKIKFINHFMANELDFCTNFCILKWHAEKRGLLAIVSSKSRWFPEKRPNFRIVVRQSKHNGNQDSRLTLIFTI